MKALIQQLLTDTSARESSADAHMAAAISEKFAPWGNKADQV